MFAYGMSRTVLLIGRYAIKVPSARNGLLFWVKGWYSNLLEADRYETARIYPAVRQLAAVYCSVWGVINVCERVALLRRRCTPDELATLPLLGFDNNGENVGVRDDGSLVALDYGDSDCYLVL